MSGPGARAARPRPVPAELVATSGGTVQGATAPRASAARPRRAPGHGAAGRFGRRLADLLGPVAAQGPPTPRALEAEARAILGRLRPAGSGPPGGVWAPSEVDRTMRMLSDFHRRLEVVLRDDDDPEALPQILAARRCIAQAQLLVLERLADLPAV
jgi:hypothetical protein